MEEGKKNMVRKSYPGMWRDLKPGYGFITATPLEGKNCHLRSSIYSFLKIFSLSGEP